MSTPFLMKLNNKQFNITPPFQPNIEFLYDDRRVIYAEKHTWPITGYLKASTSTNLIAQYTSLLTNIKTAAFTVKFMDSTGAVIRQITTGHTDGKGPMCTSYSIPDPAAWSTYLKFSLTIEAIIKRHASASSGIIKQNYNETYSYDRMDGNKLTLTRSGTLETDTNTSAKTKAEALRLTASLTQDIVSDEIEISEDDTQARFTFSRKDRSDTKPDGNTTNADKNRNEQTSGGVITTTWNATFTGGGAYNSALTVLNNGFGDGAGSAGKISSKTMNYNKDKGSWQVSVTRQKAASTSGYIRIDEQVSATGGIQPIVDRQVQGGPPVLFRGRFTSVRISQSISMTSFTRSLLEGDTYSLISAPIGMSQDDISDETISPVIISSVAASGEPLMFVRTFSRTFVKDDFSYKDAISNYGVHYIN
jgi:hypothetical protein